MQATAVAAIISIASPVRTCRCCCYWRCLSCDVVAKKDVTCGTCNILCPAQRKKRQTTTTTPVRQKRIRKHTNTLTSVEHILIFQCLPLLLPLRPGTCMRFLGPGKINSKKIALTLLHENKNKRHSKGERKNVTNEWTTKTNIWTDGLNV